MKLASTHHETEELGGGRFRSRFHLKLIGYDRGQGLRRCTNVAATNQGGGLPIQLREAFDLDIADHLAGNSPVVRFGKGQSHASFTPLGTNNVNVTHPADNVWLFADAWNGADYRLIPANQKLDKAILLRTGHPQQFSVRLDSHAGLSLDTLATPDFRILQPTLENPQTGESIALAWLVSVQGGKTVLTVNLPSGDFSGWVLDPTLALQPDGTDGVDTLISGAVSVSGYNYGISTVLNAGENYAAGASYPQRGLLAIALTGLPAGVSVSLGQLSLYCVSEVDTTDRTVGVHRALTQWYEGTKNGAAPNAGQDGSTWNLRNANGAVAWGAAGGLAGTDFAAIATDSKVITAPSATYTFTVTADVAAWVAGASNFGWWTNNTVETSNSLSLKRFPSSDNAEPSQRPSLTVEYALPGGGGIFQSSVFRSAIFGNTMVR